MLLLALGASFACILVTILFRLVTRVITNLRVRASLAHIPGPTEGHWLFGHTIDLFVTNHARRYDYVWERLRDQCTKVMRINTIILSNKPVELVVIEPAAVQHMLKTNVDNYIKNTADGEELFYHFTQFLGDGIFALSHGPNAPDKGKAWYLQRKITSQMFTTNEFKNFIFESFCEKADILVEQLGKHADGRPVDLQTWFFKYTMDAFGQIAFNTDFNSLEGESSEYGEAFDGAHKSFIQFYHKYMLIAVLMELHPASSKIRRCVEWVLHKIIPELKDFDKHRQVLQQYTKKVIEDHANTPPEQLAASKDILGLFLKASSDQPTPFSKKYLADIVLNMIIAGRDTTACLMSWTFYELARNPEVLGKLRSELRGADSNDFECMRKHAYLTAVLHEVGRLWPPVPMDGKIAAGDDVLPDGTQVPKGCSVAYCPYQMGRDPDLWESPEKFQPERWLEDGNFKAPSPFKYPVFQAGPRVCLGMNFALMEASIATTKILQNFDFELESNELLYPDTGKLTMSIRGPLNMIFKPRTN